MKSQNEKLLEVCRIVWGGYGSAPAYAVDKLREILGLQSSVEKEKVVVNSTLNGKPYQEIGEVYKYETPQPKEWCKCQVMVAKTADALKEDASVNFCPYCGKTPRPTPRSLREDLEVVLEHEAKKFLCKETTDKLSYYHTFENLADKVIEFLQKQEK